MIVITGTKRSGTSMWMQVLRAAGIRTIGAAFSKAWKETIEEANKRGFYESRYRRGIYYATNPHPETGVWLRPRETRDLGVKVFVPGVIRSDVVYLSRVVASVRPFRQYASSLTRLYEMERVSHEAKGRGQFLSPHLDPVLEWWLENFLLVRDLTTRNYPARLISYEAMLESPAKICDEVFGWIGSGDAELAAAAVHPEDRTQTPDEVPALVHPCQDVFDEYHERIKTGTGFDAAFLTRMNETHGKLLPEIEGALDQLAHRARDRRERLAAFAKEKAERGETPPRVGNRPENALDPDRLDALLHPQRRGALEDEEFYASDSEAK
jgi:hypothetical protein